MATPTPPPPARSASSAAAQADADAASQAVARLARMPAAVQLKVLSQLAPALYQDPTEKSTAAVAPQDCPPLEAGPFDWDRIVHGLATQGAVVCYPGLGEDLSREVLAALSELDLRPGKMGLAWHEESLRGDKFVWLRPDVVDAHSALARCMAVIESWRETLNKRCGLNLTESKFMAACYPGGGARYVRHSDVSPLVPDRRITAIVYLNDNWQRAHGGELHIDVRPDMRTMAVYPMLDRVLFFDSVLEHEVCPAYRPRYAVTGWFYGPQPVLDKLRAADDA